MAYLSFVNLVVNLVLIGLILVIQFVHYPLFKNVGRDNFLNYINLHSKKITWIVAPLMILELIICTILVFQDLNYINVCALIFVLIIWASTFFIQVPIHNKLQNKYDEVLINKLVRSNWIRTICWLLKGILLTTHYFY